MKVILLQDVKGVGKKDQIIDAADGYVRNFLLPKKLAVVADKQSLAGLERKLAGEAAGRAKDLEDAQALKAEIEGKVVTLALKTGGGDKLFGSVTNKEIAEALLGAGIDIDRKKITIPDAIKTLGEHSAVARLHTDVTAKISLVIK
ncbi:MAG: 50S ribosomal protein L9, partial [Defluviitaleaceae bacterium]|nr:50S ribosomal protein L9 [Defluviitaleaceae bacterium]